MRRRLSCAWALLLGMIAPVYGQGGPCADCFNAAEEEARKCLDNAISADDRNSCLDNRRVRYKACSDNQCQTVREEAAITETQAIAVRPGLAPYTPTEGEWLALLARAGLRREASPDRPYSLDVFLADPQTLHITIRHASTMDREQLRRAIESARDMIRNTAKGYGWDKWVKIRETVEMYPAKK